MPKVCCNNCGKLFHVKPNTLLLGWGKYCSRACKAQSQFNGVKLKCFICRTELYRGPAKYEHSKSKKFFCSKRCQTIWRNAYFSKERHSNWINGSSVYRQILQNLKDPICLLCANKDARVLVAHHKDHNRKNNKVSNLTWLCYNCHHLVHFDSIMDERVRNF